MAANDKQVGGEHYKLEGAPQHWDVVHALGWDYLVGCATKYLWRMGRKGDEAKKLEDLDKAIHYLQKKREQMVPLAFCICTICGRPAIDCICGEATRSYVDQG